MEVAEFDIPQGVRFNLPVDYAHNIDHAPVRLLDEVFSSGLLVRWDDAEIQFVSNEGGCAYTRSGILGFYLVYGKMMIWDMVDFSAKVEEDYHLPIVYAEQKDEQALRTLVTQMMSQGVPIQPLRECRRA